MIHEGFHLFGQRNLFPTALKFPSWPVEGSDRDRENSACYDSEDEIRQLFAREMNSLQEAYRLAGKQRGQGAAHEYLKAFKQFREARYAVLIKDRSGSSNLADCHRGESRMEMLEGFPDFVSLAALLDSGLIQPEDVLSYVSVTKSLNGPYYQFGALQLLTLRELDRAEFLKVLKRLSASSDWSEGIFAQTQKFLGK